MRPLPSRRAAALAALCALALPGARLSAGTAEPPAESLAPTAYRRAAAPVPGPTTAESAPEAASPPAEEAPSASPTAAPTIAADYDLPMPWGEARFERFRALYATPGGAKWLKAVFERSEPYLPWIAERVRHYGLPEELVYLPVIESEYNPRAVSKSGATGLWQFMKNSISGYGMRIDDWVDERRDFMKSTDGALRKLADNKAALGSWELALAAYNAGLGAVSRAVKRAGTADYWELCARGELPPETVSYVPKFLAAASILRYPARHGLAPRWGEAPAWTRVELGRAVDLVLLSEAVGVPLEDLKRANAELRYAVTPPYKDYGLKVPAAAEQALRALLADSSRPLVRYYMHKVGFGDTISAISRHYGAPQAMIVQANPGLHPDKIRLGQVIVVPALREAGPMERPQTADGGLDFSGSHLVAKGDTLWSLSLRYEVNPELLAEKNGLELGATLREGSSLRVPILQ